MDKVLQWVANGAGLSGILVCVLAGVMRLIGSNTVQGYESITLFIAGIAAMVFACLIKLHQLSSR